MKERCHELEETECHLKSHLQEMEQSFLNKDEELRLAEQARSTLENNLEKYLHEYRVSVGADLKNVFDRVWDKC